MVNLKVQVKVHVLLVAQLLVVAVRFNYLIFGEK